MERKEKVRSIIGTIVMVEQSKKTLVCKKRIILCGQKIAISIAKSTTSRITETPEILAIVMQTTTVVITTPTIMMETITDIIITPAIVLETITSVIVTPAIGVIATIARNLAP